MKIEKEFIPYEQALELKELGFNEYCLGLYSYASRNTIDMQHVIHKCKASSKLIWMRVPTPTFSQAFRWFREKYGCEFHIECRKHTSVKYYEVFLFDGNKSSMVFGKSLKYEEAELECLKKLIEIIKNKL
jgi:hypothetical protein